VKSPIPAAAGGSAVVTVAAQAPSNGAAQRRVAAAPASRALGGSGTACSDPGTARESSSRHAARDGEQHGIRA
jgi:hypothetical protein